MIGAIAGLAVRIGVPGRFARPAAWAFVILVLVAIAWAAVAVVYRTGSAAGGAAQRVEAAEQRERHVGQARDDERTVHRVGLAIAERTARVDAATDRQLQTTIKELRDAIDAVPPAAPGAAVPAAPVDRLRDELNASIARANRSADPAAAGR